MSQIRMLNKSFNAREYVKWVQRSLNRLLETSLPVDGDDQSEPYRSAVKEFNQLFLRRNSSEVDAKTQNALIKANEMDPRYVTWVQAALFQALNMVETAGMDAAVVPGQTMSSAMRQMMRSFQNTQPGLMVDGFVGFKTELTLIAVTGMVSPGTEGTNVAAFIDRSGHPTAGEFYRTFPDEPVLPSGVVHVSTVTELTGMTVSSLLKEILDSGHRNILITCHGNSKGLSIPLIEGVEVKLHSFAAELLAQWRDGKQNEAAMANSLGWDKWKLRPRGAFEDRVKRIGKRQLGRVELRSCNTGANVETLNNLRLFFNCKSLTAPNIPDGYAGIDPGSATSSAKEWSDFRKKHQVRVEKGFPPNRFAIAKKLGKGNKLTFFAITESSLGFRNFVDNHFVMPKSFKVGARIPGHALIPSGNPIFPADSAYRKHLKKVDEGK